MAAHTSVSLHHNLHFYIHICGGRSMATIKSLFHLDTIMQCRVCTIAHKGVRLGIPKSYKSFILLCFISFNYARCISDCLSHPMNVFLAEIFFLLVSQPACSHRQTVLSRADKTDGMSWWHVATTTAFIFVLCCFVASVFFFFLFASSFFVGYRVAR